ncbi:MAG: hypothetical protein NTW87_08915 [Planctomycetota bacterium]|nr:hypothetical protein [Planctomycetota bacterium]
MTTARQIPQARPAAAVNEKRIAALRKTISAVDLDLATRTADLAETDNALAAITKDEAAIKQRYARHAAIDRARAENRNYAGRHTATLTNEAERQIDIDAQAVAKDRARAEAQFRTIAADIAKLTAKKASAEEELRQELGR